MRKKLQEMGSNQRHTFTAKYGTIGYKRTFSSIDSVHYQPTIMFKDVEFEGKTITDHLWFNYTKGFAKLQKLHDGDVVQFDGRISAYTKKGSKLDYDIERPTKIKLLNRKPEANTLPDPYDDKYALVGYIMKTNKDFYLANGRPYEEWYVNQYQKWLKNAEKFNNLSDDEKHSRIVNKAENYIQQKETKELAVRVTKFGNEIVKLTQLTKEKDDSAIEKQLVHCQRQEKKINRLLERVNELFEVYKLSDFDDLVVQHSIYQEKVNRYHHAWLSLSKINDEQSQVVVSDVQEKIENLLNSVEVLASISISLSDITKILTKYSPTKMAWDYLEDERRKKEEPKYNQLRQEILDKEDTIDLSYNLPAMGLAKEVDEYEQYCISIRNITLPRRKKARRAEQKKRRAEQKKSPAKCKKRYKKLSEAISLSEYRIAQIDKYNLKEKLDNGKYTKFIEKYNQANILFKECKTYQNRKEHFDELYSITQELKACIRSIKTPIKRNIIVIKTQGRTNN